MQIQFITIKVLIQCHLGIKLIQCRALFHAGMKGSRNNPFSNDVTLNYFYIPTRDVSQLKDNSLMTLIFMMAKDNVLMKMISIQFLITKLKSFHYP